MQKINTQKNPLRRVKLYELDSNGTWLDKGTGHLSIVFKEKMKDLKFVVNNELNNKIILTAKIVIQDIYQKQQETLIVWNDPDTNQDIALSFQEPKGCEEIWQFLNALIEKNEPLDSDEYSLGEINFKNLPRIIEIINGVEMIEREKFVNSMISRNSHIKLFSLFDKCEEMGKKDLEIFFIIFQKLILLNDIQLLDVLFSQDCILRLMACLEYDPQVSTEKRVSHRNILSKKTIFKEVIPLDNEELREKIHQTYRVQYLKDVVLARTIDDPTFQTLNSFIVFNQIEIINHLKTEADYLKSVFNKAKAIDTPKDDLFNILQFINELFSLSKTLQMNARNEFFDQLLSYGVFEVLIITIGKGDNNLLVKSLDIINITLTNDASFFRKYLVSQKYSNTLLMKIISSFNNDSCIASLKGQIGSILRQLIEPEMEFAYFNENFGNNNVTREEVIEIFYDKCFPEIIKPLTQNDIPLTDCLETKHYIIELLNFCVRHHHQKIKVILIEQNLPTKILGLLNQDQKYVQLSAIRFLRAFIGSKDAVLVKFSISHKLFHPLIEIFKRNINRYNLINSSILDIFHFIYKEKNTALILHLVENFRDTFEKVDYIDLFKNFVKKYDNIKSQVDESQKTPLIESKVKRELEKDREESWFDDSDSDEGQTFSTENSKLKRYDSLTSLITQQFMKENDTDKNNNKNNNNNGNSSSNGSSNNSNNNSNKQLDLNSVFNLDSDQPPSDSVDTPKKTLNISLNSNHVNKSDNKPQEESPKKHKLDDSNSHEDNIQVKKTKISTNEENK